MDSDILYKVGRTDFDEDCEFVIDLVRYHRNPTNESVSKLHHFYIGYIYRYFEQFKIRYNDIGSEYHHIFAEKINLYEDLLKAYFSKFNGQRLDLLAIIEIFTVICELNCMIIDQEYAPVNDYVGKNGDMVTYPLVNNTGYHAYNTFLYALENEVNLIGFPIGQSFFDITSTEYYDIGQIEYCPLEFVIHDYMHLQSMTDNGLLSKENRYHISRIRNSILTDENLIQEDKEVGIFGIWFITHEIYRPIYPHKPIIINEDDFYGIIDNDFGMVASERLYSDIKIDDYSTFHEYISTMGHHSCRDRCSHSSEEINTYNNILVLLRAQKLISLYGNLE